MTGLLIAETQRYLSRRITRFFPLALALLMVIGVVIAYFVIRSQDNSIDFVNDLAGFGDAVDGPAAGVEQPDSSTSILGPLGFLLPIMAFTLGASFFGADQKNGVIELLLTWQPKRLRFLGSRSIGGYVVTALIAMVLSRLLRRRTLRVGFGRWYNRWDNGANVGLDGSRCCSQRDRGRVVLPAGLGANRPAQQLDRLDHRLHDLRLRHREPPPGLCRVHWSLAADDQRRRLHLRLKRCAL